MVRGILIDPWLKTIVPVEVGPDHHDIYRHLSNVMGPKVEIFTSGMVWPNGDTLYVDDEGLLKSGMRLFQIGRPDGQPLAGNGLILGSDNQGRTRDAKSGLVDIQTMVKWTNLVTA